MMAQIDELVALLAIARNPAESKAAADGALTKAAKIADILAKTERGGDHRKSVHELMREVNAARPLVNKPYLHKDTGEPYQSLILAFDERSNAASMVYVLSTMPALKFHKPIDEFRDSFEEGFPDGARP